MITKTFRYYGNTLMVTKGIMPIRNGGHKLLCSDGIIRGATIGEKPDSLINMPCAVCIGGKRITGNTGTMQDSEGEKCYIFLHHTEGQKHKHSLPDWPTDTKDINALVGKAYDDKSLAANRKYKRYTVNVGNIGGVYSGFSIKEGIKVFNEYKHQSKSLYGRAAGEDVVLYSDGEPEREYNAPNVIPKNKEVADVIKYYKGQLMHNKTIGYFSVYFFVTRTDWNHSTGINTSPTSNFIIVSIDRKTKIRETTKRIISKLKELKRTTN